MHLEPEIWSPQCLNQEALHQKGNTNCGDPLYMAVQVSACGTFTFCTSWHVTKHLDLLSVFTPLILFNLKVDGSYTSMYMEDSRPHPSQVIQSCECMFWKCDRTRGCGENMGKQGARVPTLGRNALMRWSTQKTKEIETLIKVAFFSLKSQPLYRGQYVVHGMQCSIEQILSFDMYCHVQWERPLPSHYSSNFHVE